MQVIKKSFFYFSIFLGAVGRLGFSILSVACTWYILIPNSPGNKYMEKLPVVLLQTSCLATISYLIMYNTNRNLIELSSLNED